jgi:protein-S-isoprenylcysteine O-methyltransferase Ste14
MPILKTILFTIFVPGTVAILVPYRIARPHWPPEAGALTIFGALLFGAGAFLYMVCAWDFAYHGRGTPAPIDPPKSLVARGPSILVRNPMYIGVLCAVLGEAAIFHAWRILVYAVFLALAFHLFVIFYEEPALKKKFGSAYDRYRQSVPRWIPKF